ncbi:hypothetical protein POTOM_002072 [Populus tomentosa]|uniref:Uncharacterized protein n=1 Tax=Populus tomentosa TaxID=118781 RepID=A0A8X8DJ08_POPTO|nr:hypothetical protein POTOM_002072 [Populus tomentosa]
MSPLHKFIPPLLKQYRMVDGNALSRQEHFNLFTSLDFQNFPSVRSLSFLDSPAIKSSANLQTLQNLKILSPSKLAQDLPRNPKSSNLSPSYVAAFLYGGFLCGAFDFVHSTYEELESLCGNHGRVEEDVHVHSSSSYLLYFYGLRTDVDCNKVSLL